MNNFSRAILIGSFLCVTAAAQAQQIVAVRIAPPSHQNEPVPAARQGYVWDAGHHEWRGDRYEWVSGQWIPARAGHDWQQRRWVRAGNGEWMLAGGTWQRRGGGGDLDRDGKINRYDKDRDGDGIPNAQDRFPDGPNRSDPLNVRGPYGDADRDGIINRYDKDRDGDGVPNNRDRHPDDPRRS